MSSCTPVPTRAASGPAADPGGEPVRLSRVLQVLVAEAGLVSAVLRSPSGDVLAVGGQVVHAVPRSRPEPSAPAAVDLPVPGPGGRPVATLTVVGAAPALLGPLRAVAAAFGLALEAPRDDLALGDHPALLLAEGALAALEAERDELADGLHDGVLQELLATRYATDAALRSGSTAATPALRDAVQAAVVALRRTVWHLRPRGRDGLPAALQQLSDRLVEAGAPALDLHVDGASAGAVAALPPAVVGTAYRLVQHLALAAGTSPAPLGVSLASPRPGLVVLDVSGADLAAPDRWARRARACGAEMSCSSGRCRLSFPPHLLARRTALSPKAVP